LAKLPQRINNRQEQATAPGESILNMWRVAAKIGTLYEVVFLHVAQTAYQSAAADWKKARE
jgi:hypothetical protein